MEFKFKVGDKVRVVPEADVDINKSLNVEVGDEGVVTMQGGVYSTGIPGVVVTNEKFKSGANMYGKHGVWFYEEELELVS